MKYTEESIKYHPNWPFIFICNICKKTHYKVNPSSLILSCKLKERICSYCQDEIEERIYSNCKNEIKDRKDDIKDCPLCNNKCFLYPDYDQYYIECKSCSLTSGNFSNSNNLIKFWNNR